MCQLTRYEIALSERAYPELSRRRLGEMNEFGIGIPQNYAKAMELYQPEIAPRDRPPFPLRSSYRAEFAIGRLYAQGKGVPQDYAKAAEWFLIAVDREPALVGRFPRQNAPLRSCTGLAWVFSGTRRVATSSCIGRTPWVRRHARRWNEIVFRPEEMKN